MPAEASGYATKNELNVLLKKGESPDFTGNEPSPLLLTLSRRERAAGCSRPVPAPSHSVPVPPRRSHPPCGTPSVATPLAGAGGGAGRDPSCCSRDGAVISGGGSGVSPRSGPAASSSVRRLPGQRQRGAPERRGE